MTKLNPFLGAGTGWVGKQQAQALFSHSAPNEFLIPVCISKPFLVGGFLSFKPYPFGN
jgi:hypothetical protein